MAGLPRSAPLRPLPPPTGRRAALVLTAALGCGCGGPKTPVVTIARLEPPPVPSAPATRAEAGTARAFIARDARDLPAGPAAAGESGDLVLRNDRLVAVIRAAKHRGRVAPTGGNLVDLAPAGGEDAFGEAALTLDPDGRVLARFEAVEVAQDGRDGGLAIVRAQGRDPRDDQVLVDVDYVLESGSPRLRAIATVTHRGRSHYRDFALGHWMSWGTLAAFAPGSGGDLQGRRTSSPWIGADGPGASVLLAGVAGLVEGIHGREFSQIVERREYLTPGAVLTWETGFYVGGGGGVAGPQSALLATRQTVTGQIQGTVRERRRQKGVSGAWVVAVERDGSLATRARTDARGAYTLDLEPGRYRLVGVAEGRSPGAPVPVEVAADGRVEPEITLEPASRIHLEVAEAGGGPLPARAVLVPKGRPTPGAPPPEPVPLVAAKGRLTQRIAPGTYELSVGAGPRHALHAQTVEIAPGATARVVVALARQIDEPTVVGLDPSVHTVHGPSSAVTAQARLTSCAVEGVDVLVATDERAGEAWPARPPGATPLALRGLEVQTADARVAVIPLVTVPTLPDVLPSTAGAALPWLRTLPGRPLTAVLRPRSRALGYFEHFAFDPSVEALPRGGFTLDFDLLGVLSPGLGAESDRAIDDYLALLRRGQRVVPLGATGTDDLATEICGQPRTWLLSAVTDAASLESALRRGEVVASGGPIVALRRLEAAGGAETVAVRVAAPDWLRPQRLELLFDAGPPVRADLPSGAGPLRFERNFPMPAGVHWVVARLDGSRREHPLYPGGLRPLAITAALPLFGAAPEKSDTPR